MSTEPSNRVVESADVSVLSDGALLTDFCETGREIGFRTLVERHARMVSSVCTAVLGNHADAEDAFQATFFVLARKASKIRNKECVVAWIHRVALRCALAARKRASHRKTTELPPADSLMQGELERVSSRAMTLALHDQLDRLPEKYRTPLIVCYLQGEDRCAAAIQLKLSEEALHKRLQRGRAILRRRLGVVGFAGIAITSLAGAAAGSGCGWASFKILESTVLVATQVRLAWAKGLMAASGQQATLSLAQGVLKTMLITSLVKSSFAVASGALLGLVAFTSLSLAQQTQPAGTAEQFALGSELALQDANLQPAAEITVAQEPEKPKIPSAVMHDAWLQYLQQRGAEKQALTWLGYQPPQPDVRWVLTQEALKGVRSGQDAATVEQALLYLRLANAVSPDVWSTELRATNTELEARSKQLENRVAELEEQLELHRENERLRKQNEELRKQIEELKKGQ